MLMQPPELLGQHTRDREVGQGVDGEPADFAGLIADEDRIDIAYLVAHEEEIEGYGRAWRTRLEAQKHKRDSRRVLVVRWKNCENLLRGRCGDFSSPDVMGVMAD